MFKSLIIGKTIGFGNILIILIAFYGPNNRKYDESTNANSDCIWFIW